MHVGKRGYRLGRVIWAAADARRKVQRSTLLLPQSYGIAIMNSTLKQQENGQKHGQTADGRLGEQKSIRPESGLSRLVRDIPAAILDGSLLQCALA